MTHNLNLKEALTYDQRKFERVYKTFELASRAVESESRSRKDFQPEESES